MSANASKMADGTWDFTFSYNPAAIAAIKDQIPGYARRYDPDWRTWNVDASYAGIAISILTKVFGSISYANLPPEPTATMSIDPDLRELHLLPSAPKILVLSAYRTLARQVHPDHGGDNAAMQRLNAAFDNLRQRGLA